MIKQSGPYCDICEKPILMSDVYEFGCSVIEKPLHSCEKCRVCWEKQLPLKSWPKSKLRDFLHYYEIGAYNERMTKEGRS